MTNGDYLRKTLTDAELANLCSFAGISYVSRFMDAFEKWCAKIDMVDTNMSKRKTRPYYWQVKYHEDKKEYEYNKRTRNVYVQIFLSMPYDKEYWT